MNAPEMLKLEAELVPLDCICPSNTHVQRLRRKRLSEEGLLELAASIQASGVINPILVRPYPPELAGHVTPTPKYELVAGERRFLASRRAGLAHIPCVIRELDDGAVIEAQLVENLQRDNLNPLEEANGYHELRELKKYDAEKIGELIGKSKSYVYARMKLLSLCPPAREALESGSIDFSKGLLLARFRSAKLQSKALGFLSNNNWGYRGAFEQLRRQFMADLTEAPFTLDRTLDGFEFKPNRNDSTVTDVGDRRLCSICPHNSANDHELATDLDGAHVCTDRPCFEVKSRFTWNVRKERATADGRTILAGADAQAALPGSHSGGFNAEYVDLDARCEEIDFPEAEPQQGKDESEDAFASRYQAWDERAAQWNPPTYRQLLAEAAIDTVLAEESKGRLRELAPLKVVRPLLKEHGVKLQVPAWMRERSEATETPEQRAAAKAREDEKRAVEIEYRARLLRAVFDKCKGPLKREDLVRIVADIWDNAHGEAWKQIYPKGIEAEKAKDDELARFIIIDRAVHEVDDLYYKPEHLHDLATRFKVDAKALRAKVVKDLKPTSAPAATDDGAKTAPKKTAKKKTAAKK